MNLFLSLLSLALVLILVMLYPVRKFLEKRVTPNGGALKKVYKILRKLHCVIGIIVIPVVYLHCRIAFHETDERSLLGGILLIILILLALTYFLRKPLGAHWKRAHQALSATLILATVVHSIVEFL